jgi:hypothetical protein
MKVVVLGTGSTSGTFAAVGGLGSTISPSSTSSLVRSMGAKRPSKCARRSLMPTLLQRSRRSVAVVIHGTLGKGIRVTWRFAVQQDFAADELARCGSVVVGIVRPS